MTPTTGLISSVSSLRWPVFLQLSYTYAQLGVPVSLTQLQVVKRLQTSCSAQEPQQGGGKGATSRRQTLEQAPGPRRKEKTVWIMELIRSFSTLSEAAKDWRVERRRYVETP